MIKAILFDLDNTLVSTADIHYEALNKALVEVTGYAIPRQEHLDKYNGLPTSVKLNELVNLGKIKEADRHKVATLKQEYTKEYIKSRIHPRANVIDTLRFFAEGYDLACVTNAIKSTTYIMLYNANIFNFFSCIITNEDIKYPKPNPAPHLMAMVQLGVGPKECLIIEDSRHGIESAEATGAKSLWVSGPEDINIEFIERNVH